jgi:hypothetical protein
MGRNKKLGLTANQSTLEFKNRQLLIRKVPNTMLLNQHERARSTSSINNKKNELILNQQLPLIKQKEQNDMAAPPEQGEPLTNKGLRITPDILSDENNNQMSNAANEDDIFMVQMKTQQAIRITKSIRKEIEIYKNDNITDNEIRKIFFAKYGYSPTLNQISNIVGMRLSIPKDIIIRAKDTYDLITTTSMLKYKIKSKCELRFYVITHFNYFELIFSLFKRRRN